MAKARAYRKVTRKVDRRMHDSGEFDTKKLSIRVNPRKGDLINTIIHEELHRKKPNLTEKQVRKKAKKEESMITINQAVKLLEKYERKRR